MECPILLCLLLTLPNCLFCYSEESKDDISFHRVPGQDFNARLMKIEALLEASLSKNYELENRIEALEGDNRQLKASVRALKTKKYDGHTPQGAAMAEEDTGAGRRVQTLDEHNVKDKRRSSRVPRIMLSAEPTVAFTATISSPSISGLGKGQTIKYDHVITNVGGAYHAVTGMFTAPATGVYVFNYNTMVEPGDNEYLELVKNGQLIQATYAHGTGENRYESTSMTVTLEVKQGEEVWVRTADYDRHGAGTVHGNTFTTFSGWLLAYTE